MSYRVTEIFATLQGEGLHAGTPAIFVRFAGCNLWTGHQIHRGRDAQRNQAACPLWCDTDFRQGEPCDSDMLIEIIKSKMEEHGHLDFPVIVFTGGEPMLQLDAVLLCKAHEAFDGVALAVETNGTVEPKLGVFDELDHICVSPKTADQTIKVREGTELKIVYPSMDPMKFDDLAQGFMWWWVSPCAQPGEEPGESFLDDTATAAAIKFCIQNPGWRLSLQTHKILGLP